jgi:hypothetical protein
MRLWQMLPCLTQPGGFLVALDSNGGIAVLIIAPPDEVAADERNLALALHGVLGRGLLVVF